MQSSEVKKEKAESDCGEEVKVIYHAEWCVVCHKIKDPICDHCGGKEREYYYNMKDKIVICIPDDDEMYISAHSRCYDQFVKAHGIKKENFEYLGRPSGDEIMCSCESED